MNFKQSLPICCNIYDLFCFALKKILMLRTLISFGKRLLCTSITSINFVEFEVKLLIISDNASEFFCVPCKRNTHATHFIVTWENPVVHLKIESN